MSPTPDRGAVAAKLRAFLQAKAPAPEARLTDGTLLREEWRLSSLGLLETVAFVEDEFDVRLRQTDLQAGGLRTVGSLADLVVARAR